MAKYRFKTDSTEPSDEQIGKHKDFGRLKANYNHATNPLYKTPLYKNKKVFLILILVALIAFLISEFMDEKGKDAKSHPKNEISQPDHPDH
jgi:hypothetical protein